jgi:hypothetical protein
MMPSRTTMLRWSFAACAVMLLTARAGLAQVAIEPIDEDAGETVEAYIADLGLTDVLAAHLRQKLATAKPEERALAANELARLYTKMLADSTDSTQRRDVETLARSLLKEFPEADGAELRIDLSKATYLRAEEIAERDRLGFATDADKLEATRILNDVIPQLTQVRERLSRDVAGLESREKQAAPDEESIIRAALGDARRVRSLAAYYEGWSRYYLSLLTDTDTGLVEAMEAFGIILNAAAGSVPSLERLPKSTVRYEHVARSCMGVALCLSRLNDTDNAVRWLDQLNITEDLPDNVDKQLFSRRLIVFAHGQRWNNVEALVRRSRVMGEDGKPTPMTVADARLLAIVSLRALREPQLRENFRTSVQGLAQQGLADLIARGELGQIVDLVQQFGTLPLGDAGFVNAYVRGMLSYDQARELHRKADGDNESPANTAPVVNAYRDAAGLFEAALTASDAKQFDAEPARVMLRKGLSLYYAGDLLPAADMFEKAQAEDRATSSIKQDALWFAVVALDAAVEKGQASQRQRRDQLAAVYIRAFPHSQNATRLLLRQVQADGIDEQQALDILLAVTPQQPLYLAARKQAARILYQQFRRAQTAQRTFAALRFVEVAEPLLNEEAAQALELSGTQGTEAALAATVRARQLADVFLSQPSPDVTRAQAALATLDRLVLRYSLDTREIESEVVYRKLQIALAKNEAAQANEIADQLRGMAGPFAIAASQLMYSTALDVWRTQEQNNEAARGVVRHGSALLAQLKGAGNAAAVREQVAKAAASLWTNLQDKQMLTLAISVDEEQVKTGTRAVSTLRRLATMREAAGNEAASLDVWNQLLASLDPGSVDWFEARYQTLRLLLETDPTKAATAYEQFRLLYPQTGPKPWGEKIDALGLRMPRITPAPNAPAGGAR